MSELEKVVVNSVLNNLVETTKNGKKYISEENLERLNLTTADKNFFPFAYNEKK